MSFILYKYVVLIFLDLFYKSNSIFRCIHIDFGKFYLILKVNYLISLYIVYYFQFCLILL